MTISVSKQKKIKSLIENGISVAEISKSTKTDYKTDQKYTNEATPKIKVTGAYTLPMQTIPVYDKRPRHILIGEPRSNYDNILSSLFFSTF